MPPIQQNHSNIVQFVICVAVVTGISQAMKTTGFIDNIGMPYMVVKGMLAFFSMYMVYYPISLMLGGISVRDRFFDRTY